MSLYASDTSVPIAKSRAEIETLVMRYGASQFGSILNPEAAMIAFTVKNRSVRFVLPLPSVDSMRISPAKRRRTQLQTEAAWDQEVRRRWRSLALLIKAKLEAVASGIMTFEEEFLPHFVVKGGLTVAQTLIPQLNDACNGQGGLLLLPAPNSTRRTE